MGATQEKGATAEFMNLDQLGAMQGMADSTVNATNDLVNSFNRELPIIVADLKEKIPLRLAFIEHSKPSPSFEAQKGSMRIERTKCLTVSVDRTPAYKRLILVTSTVTCQAQNPKWLIELEEDYRSGTRKTASVRNDTPSLLLRIDPSPRYIWWSASSDNQKVVDAFADALLGRSGLSEFSFEPKSSEAKRAEPKGCQNTVALFVAFGLLATLFTR
jgi:hypothetical protein